MSRLIDADALVERIIAKVRDTSFFSMIMAEISNVIASLPTVDAEPIRHGKWIKDRLDSIRKCSLCGAVIYRHEDLFDYCPWCGTRMDEVEE